MYDADISSFPGDGILEELEFNSSKSLNSEQFNKLMEVNKRNDRGYNIIYRFVYEEDENNNLRRKKRKIELYTSGSIGTKIRDAETGEYYPYLVGSYDEYLFYSVILATGECKSKNGSSILFYLSPQHYCQHLNKEVSSEQIKAWELRRQKRIDELEQLKQKKTKVKVIT